MSDKTVQELLDNVRGEIPSLFRVCESLAMLDMIASFGQLVVSLHKYPVLIVSLSTLDTPINTGC